MTLEVGDIAPDFAVSHDGKATTLYSMAEKGPVVVYFYPRDFTPGCTKQAKGFRDEYADFQRADAQIVGISSDGDSSHCQFQQAHSLPFSLVSDPESAIASSYKVGSLFGLMPGRVTFVVGERGKILDVYSANLFVSSHVGHCLKFVQALAEERK